MGLALVLIALLIAGAPLIPMAISRIAPDHPGTIRPASAQDQTEARDANAGQAGQAGPGLIDRAGGAGILRLGAQPAWVDPEGVFVAEILLKNELTPTQAIRAHLSDRVADRSEFAASLRGEVPAELAQIEMTAGGNVATLTIPLSAQPDEERYTITEGGIYPIRIELVEVAELSKPAALTGPTAAATDGSGDQAGTGAVDEAGAIEAPPGDNSAGDPAIDNDEGSEDEEFSEPDEVVAELITHLVRVPETAPGDMPLMVSPVVDLHEPLVLDGNQPITITEDRERTRSIVRALSEFPRVAATVRPTPEMVDRLASAGGDRALLENLRTATEQREVLATPYVRLDTSAWLGAELNVELVTRLTLGTDTLTEALGVRPDRRILIHDGRIPSGLLDELRTLGVDALVVDEAHLDILDDEAYPFTMLQKFQLAEPERGTSVALAADSALSDHLRGADPILAAHHLLADLAVLAMELPQTERAAVVKPAEDELFDGAALRTLLVGLRAHPMLRATTLDRAFDRASLAREGSTDTEGQILQRRLRPDPVAAIGGYPEQLKQANAQLDAYRGMVGPDSVRPTPWEQMIRLSASGELTATRRTDLLDEVIDGIRSQTRGIDVPESQSVTLTNRSGEIPLRLRNSLGYPVRVRIEVESDKLEIAEEDRTRVVVLEDGRNPIGLGVRARGSGDSRLNVTVTSPDGHLALGEGRYTIRSTSVSGFGIALSVGAGLVLVIWWLRNNRDRRRDRRLIRQEQASATV